MAPHRSRHALLRALTKEKGLTARSQLAAESLCLRKPAAGSHQLRVRALVPSSDRHKCNVVWVLGASLGRTITVQCAHHAWCGHCQLDGLRLAKSSNLRHNEWANPDAHSKQNPDGLTLLFARVTQGTWNELTKSAKEDRAEEVRGVQASRLVSDAPPL